MATTYVIKDGLPEYTVYTGPGDNIYTIGGSVDAGERVEVLWKEGMYRFIEYYLTGTTIPKRGYVHKTVLENQGLGAEKYFTKKTRYVNNSGYTYTGPAQSFARPKDYDYLTYGRSVDYLYPEKVNNFAFVEYRSTGASGALVRAYFNANNLGVDPT